MFLCCLIVKDPFEKEFHICYISMLLRKEKKRKEKKRKEKSKRKG